MKPRKYDFQATPYDRRALRYLIAEFAREAQVDPSFVRWAVLGLFESAFDVRRRERRAHKTGRGAFDLAQVHRFEQLELLRLALEVQLAASASGRLLCAALQNGNTESSWRARCTEEIGCALADGAGVDGELLACAMQDRKHWSSALQLAEHLQSCSDGMRDKWSIIRALFAAGQQTQARQLAQRVDFSRLTRARRSSLMECLAIDLERREQQRAALRHFESASTLGGWVRTDLAAALVAMELGASEALARSSARLVARPDLIIRGPGALLELRAKRDLMAREINGRHLYELERLMHEHSTPAIGKPRPAH